MEKFLKMLRDVLPLMTEEVEIDSIQFREKPPTIEILCSILGLAEIEMQLRETAFHLYAL